MYIANQFYQKMSERGVGVVKPNNPEIIVSQEPRMPLKCHPRCCQYVSQTKS